MGKKQRILAVVAPRRGVRVVFALVAVLFMGSLTSPADATAGGLAGAPVSPRWATSDAGVARPGRPEPAPLDLGMVAALIGAAFAAGVLLACRPRLAQRRILRRFRAQLWDADVAKICAPPANLDSSRNRAPPHPLDPRAGS